MPSSSGKKTSQVESGSVARKQVEESASSRKAGDSAAARKTSGDAARKGADSGSRKAGADSGQTKISSKIQRTISKTPEPLPIVDELQDVDSMSDEDLMKLCQEGDEGAFEILFQRYETAALSFIHRLIGDQSRTEALGQEAFMRIFKDAKSYQYPRSFTTWFYTIVRNLCKNELRWRSRHPTVSIEENAGHSGGSNSENTARIADFLATASTDPLDKMVSNEMNQKLEQALQELPDLERDILILNRFQGLKYREISEIVGVPVGTVRARIYSALERLRKSIKDYL